MNVTKRGLGANYVVSIGVVLAALLLVQLLSAAPPGTRVWTAVGLLSAVLLAAAYYWLPRAGLDSEGVWTVAECSALGLALPTLATAWLLARGTPLSAPPTVALASNVATGGVIGALVGVARELHRTVERTRVRNDVLNRVLRHNLRNDMTVVLGRLDHLQDDLSEPQRRDVEAIKRQIDGLVDLSERVRRVDIALERGREGTDPVDVVAVVEQRLATLQATYDLDIEARLPPVAQVYADELFGPVFVDVIESAAANCDTPPTLAVAVERQFQWVRIRIEDRDNSIPEPDLAVVADGAETEMVHGHGVEVWLLDWLVEGYGGEVTVETTDGQRAIEIRLRRARGGIPSLR